MNSQYTHTLATITRVDSDYRMTDVIFHSLRECSPSVAVEDELELNF